MDPPPIPKMNIFSKLINPKKNDYQSKLNTEIELYEKIFDHNLSQSVPPSWDKVEKYFADILELKCGVRNLYEYVEKHVVKNKLKKVKILGLGSGACGNELDGIIPLLTKHNIAVELSCLDINQHALDIAQAEALKRGVKFIPLVKDINSYNIKKNTYDVIVAYASLHHFMKLNRLCKQINNGLKKNGVLVTVDIPTQNGYLMWPETYDVVCNLWKIIPPQFKLDHTGFSKPTHVEFFPNIDYSKDSFECVNSKDVIPSLRKNLKEVVFVPAMSICRRFFDTKFGPNYDFSKSLDNSIFTFITMLDSYYLEKNILKPETFFGAYLKK